jgi:hypothetical protein
MLRADAGSALSVRAMRTTHNGFSAHLAKMRGLVGDVHSRVAPHI